MARNPRRLAGSRAVRFNEVVRRLDGSKHAGAEELRRVAGRFPTRWTRYYLDLSDPLDPQDPIRRIAYPDRSELLPDPAAISDPVGERNVSPLPFVVRKHADRAILLVTSRCHVYCRFCFRRSFPDGAHRDPTTFDLDRALQYLEQQHELREVILSGGDPLVLDDGELRQLLQRLSAIPQLEQLRVHTRAPVHDPARVTPRLARTLAAGLPTWVVLHFDHPREVTEQARRAAAILLEAGLPLMNQTVLLAGVNDDPAILERLFRALMRARIKPYYLHHPDRVAGAGSFYVSVERGLEIYRELRRRLAGGPALPSYVIDLPDGSGKIPVESLP